MIYHVADVGHSMVLRNFLHQFHSLHALFAGPD